MKLYNVNKEYNKNCKIIADNNTIKIIISNKFMLIKYYYDIN